MLKIFILSLLFAAHPVHVTLLSVEYSAESEAFNVYLKVYYDDFKTDYQLLTGMTPDFDLSGNKEAAIKMITDYIKEKVQIFAGKIKLDGKIKDLNLADNELKMSLLYDYQKRSRVFIVRNSILTDIYKDQSNLLIFRYGNFEEGIKLTAEKREQIFNIK
jgi:hypothetical protein